MKNKYFDLMRKSAKEYAKDWHRHNQLTPLGNALIHCYDNPHEMGWWDDVMFRLGGQVICVWWTHPRMQFADQTNEMARNLMPPSPPWNLREGSVANYKRLGKNKKRKKIVSYTMAPIHDTWKEWSAECDKKTEEVRRTTDLVIRPSMKIEQLNWCRGVSLCIPEEAIDAVSVEKMAEIAKQLLRGETTLEELYPDYTYTRHDYEADGVKTKNPEFWWTK